MTKEPKNSQNVMFTKKWFCLLSSISSWSLSAWVFMSPIRGSWNWCWWVDTAQRMLRWRLAHSPSLPPPLPSLLVVDMKAIRTMWGRLSRGTQAPQAQRPFFPHGKEAGLASGKTETKKSGLWFQQKNRPTLMAINSHRLKYHFPSTRTQWEGHVALIWKEWEK